ncbi:MAG: F0F1 ATP synthase subunit epsilon [Gammaproteobacteria bacterium]|nr:F0F1 ATP synthase subunit epsilon [Gammaproteobacteria bacterium]|tara:strand:- start:3262 stop:3675 length:414 start_codon:yes stop_codon:yes gene_type:complete
MALIQCSIVSPEGEVFSGEVEMLTADGGAGEIAITPRHAPLLTNLKPGPVKLVLEGGEEEVFFASGGFLEVQPGSVTLLTDVAERADDIDAAEAERAKELAERELDDQKSEMDYSLAAAQLAEAAARLKALQKLRKK